MPSWLNKPMSTEMDNQWSRAELDELLDPPQHMYSVDEETGARTSPQDWLNPWGEQTDLARPYGNLPFTPEGGTGQRGPRYAQSIAEHIAATGEDDRCPKGQHTDTETGECVPDTDGECPNEGEHKDSETGECVPDDEKKTTPQNYDPFTGKWGEGDWDPNDWGDYMDVPEYQGPDRPDFGKFEYDAWQAPDEFKAPTMEEAQAAPGFQMRMEQGRKALEASAAAKGMSRSGQTHTDLIDYGQRMGEMGYQDVYGRRAGEHQQRRGELERDYQTGYGTARDIYGIGRKNLADLYGYERQEARDQWAPKFAQWKTRQDYGQRRDELDYSRKWDEYMTAGRRAESVDAKKRAWEAFDASDRRGPAPGRYEW